MSKSKNAGLFVFLLIVAGIFIIGLSRFIPLKHLFHMPTLACNPQLWLSPRSISIIPLLLTLLWFVIVVWVYKDAENNGMSGLLWGLLVLVGNIVGLLVYLIFRSMTSTGALQPSPAPHCPNCHRPVQYDFNVCPNCGTDLNKQCPNCQKNVEANWNVCPYCGTNVK